MKVNKNETGGLSEAECRKYVKRYRTILTQGGKELPEIPKRRDGKRGRIAKSDAHNLHEALVILEECVLRFMSDPDVSFTKAQFANCRDGPIIVTTRYDLGGNFSRTYRSNHHK